MKNNKRSRDCFSSCSFNCDTIFICAMAYVKTNVEGTVNILEACREFGIESWFIPLLLKLMEQQNMSLLMKTILYRVSRHILHQNSRR